MQRVIGRYALFDEIAAGGMATVHIGRLLGPVGFSRTVAIKRLHAQFAKDPEFVSMFLDEARLAARVRHPNVVQTLDVVALHGELFLVMEFVQGESLSRLLRATRARGMRVSPRIAMSVIIGVLHGLHAAHEATSERGQPLGIVHRDVSPQNILVGLDGIPRVLDFGVAKAQSRMQTTAEGQFKGKLGYSSPEQIREAPLDRRVDVYSASVVLWEALVGKRLFEGETPLGLMSQVLNKNVPRPSELVNGLPRGLDDVVLRGLAREPEHRFATARAMAIALENLGAFATQRNIGEWVESTSDGLSARMRRVAEVESISSVFTVPASSRPHPQAAEPVPRSLPPRSVPRPAPRTPPPPPVEDWGTGPPTLRDPVPVFVDAIGESPSERTIEVAVPSIPHSRDPETIPYERPNATLRLPAVGYTPSPPPPAYAPAHSPPPPAYAPVHTPPPPYNPPHEPASVVYQPSFPPPPAVPSMAMPPSARTALAATVRRPRIRRPWIGVTLWGTAISIGLAIVFASMELLRAKVTAPSPGAPAPSGSIAPESPSPATPSAR